MIDYKYVRLILFIITFLFLGQFYTHSDDLETSIKFCKYPKVASIKTEDLLRYLGSYNNDNCFLIQIYQDFNKKLSKKDLDIYREIMKIERNKEKLDSFEELMTAYVMFGGKMFFVYHKEYRDKLNKIIPNTTQRFYIIMALWIQKQIDLDKKYSGILKILNERFYEEKLTVKLAIKYFKERILYDIDIKIKETNDFFKLVKFNEVKKEENLRFEDVKELKDFYFKKSKENYKKLIQKINNLYNSKNKLYHEKFSRIIYFIRQMSSRLAERIINEMKMKMNL